MTVYKGHVWATPRKELRKLGLEESAVRLLPDIRVEQRVVEIRREAPKVWGCWLKGTTVCIAAFESKAKAVDVVENVIRTKYEVIDATT